MKHFNLSFDEVVYKMTYLNVMMLNATVPYIPRNKSKIRPHTGKSDTMPLAAPLVEPDQYEQYFNALNSKIK